MRSQKEAAAAARSTATDRITTYVTYGQLRPSFVKPPPIQVTGVPHLQALHLQQTSLELGGSVNHRRAMLTWMVQWFMHSADSQLRSPFHN